MPRYSRRRFVWLVATLVASGVWGPGFADEARAQGKAEPRAGAAALPGTWESVTRSQGGIGQILELHKDGTAIRRAAAMVDFTYKLDGDHLVTSFTDPKTGKAQESAHQVRFDGDKLIESTQGREVRLTRRQAGRAGEPQIVGLWSYPHEAGGTAYVMYSPDGRMIFRLPIRSDRGTWRALPTEITMTFSSPRTLRYRLDGGRLFLTDDQNKTQEYQRAELVDYPRP